MKKISNNTKIILLLLLAFFILNKSSKQYCISCGPFGDGDGGVAPSDATGGGATKFVVPEAGINPIESSQSGFSLFNIDPSAPAAALVPITFIGLIIFLITKVPL